MKTLIIGGGLAGMTAAYELRKAGAEVVLLEASCRLGGKAGADRLGTDYHEHGNHFFPAWYLNTRRLLKELELSSNLVDIEKLHHLRKGRFPSYETLVIPTRLFYLPRNIVARALPWAEVALLIYAFLDLASQSDMPLSMSIREGSPRCAASVKDSTKRWRPTSSFWPCRSRWS